MKTLTVALMAAALMGASQASAAVRPGDTFSFDVLGYNSATDVGYFVAGPLTSTFGTTQTYSGAGIDGQDITLSSSEVIGSTTTTDYFTVSTPTNFVNESSLNGLPVSGLEFDLGNGNSGSNTVDLSTPIGSYTVAGDAIYNSNTKISLNPSLTLSNGNMSLALVEGVQSGANAINAYSVHQFDVSVSYANPVSAAPEPSSWALMMLGVGAMGMLLRSRRRQPRLAYATV